MSFKVGDKVKLNSKAIVGSDLILTIEDEALSQFLLSNGWMVQKDWVQLATPKEIKQGYRDE